MKKFLIRCLLFLLTIAGLLTLVELYMRHLPNSYRQKHEWMSAHAQDVEVLMLGNSHGLFGLRPDCFERVAYNMCQVSQTLEYDEYLLMHYAPHYKRLTDVFLVVDYSGFFDLPLEQTERFRCTYYRLYMDYPKHSLWSRYGLELSDVSAMKEKVSNVGTQCDSTGWNPAYTMSERSPDYLSEEAVVTAVERHRCKDWNVAEENRSTLQRIVRWCRCRNLRLILLQAPVSKAYYSLLDRRQLTYLRESLEATGAIVADYAADPHFVDADFFDPDHLADEGAAKWSQMISERFQKSIIKNIE
jgi:hypothetical protein